MGKSVDYYALFGITESSSEEDILAAFRHRIEDIYDWRRENLPPDVMFERMEFYKRAITVICEEKNIPSSRISSYLDSAGYYEDPYERERGIPVMLLGVAIICLGVYFLFKEHERDSRYVGVFIYYSFVLGSSFILHCLSGERSFAEVIRLCYPVAIKTGRRNMGRTFIKRTFLISMFIFAYFLLLAIEAKSYPWMYDHTNPIIRWRRVWSFYFGISIFGLSSFLLFFFENKGTPWRVV